MTSRKNASIQGGNQEIKRIDGFRRRLTQKEVELRAKSVEAKELFAELKKATRQQDKLGDSLARYQRLAAQPRPFPGSRVPETRQGLMPESRSG